MIGRKLKNRYQITEHLGDGSTATVYRAIDTRLGREVALKVLLPHVRDNTRERFFQEATAVAQLNHPNIMSIFDIDEDAGQHFLVVEFVEGAPLSDYVPSPPEMVVELGQQIALALQYAHERQIIHRDIKPANIKVTPDGVVKIMDLGLALPREAKRVTTAGMVIGTPAYISPEQAQGHKLDNRTDIYSLGVVLYEMATGRLPFDSDDIPSLLLQQVKQPPPPPRLLVPELPIGLENVILKALEKTTARRFQTCGALAAALRASIGGEVTDGIISTRAAQQITTGQHKSPTIRLVLADDHTVVRRAFASLLEARDDFVVVAEASDGQSALEQTIALNPDVLVLDLNMPGKGGLEILPDVRKRAPNVKVLILSGREEEWYIMQAMRAGAHGYILKSSDENNLIEGILDVMKGELVLGQGVAEKIVGGMTGTPSSGHTALEPNERQLLLYVAAGFENDSIARRLNISMPTVIETLASAMDKLGSRDRHSAALAALKRGIISLDDVQNLN